MFLGFGRSKLWLIAITIISLLLIWQSINISASKINVYSQSSEEGSESSSQHSYYVSRTGDNTDGLSWDTAWSELDQIDWSVVKPGDVIYLDGGETQMIYETEMYIDQSGTEEQPIYIQRSTEPEHNGQVVFFGGREVGLPYCGQTDYDTSKEDSIREYGIRIHQDAHIIIDGMDWSGIVIHGYRRNGIRLDTDVANITMRHLDIYNNGALQYRDDELRSDSPGIRLGGGNITVQRTLIHDNGQDAMQGVWKATDAPLNLLIEQSWFYNERRHPTVDESFNWCTHSDALQIFTGGITSGITIKESIMGPGFTNTLIWGDQWADIVDVLIEDTLIVKGADNNITGHSSITDMHNWTLNRVTLHCPNTKYTCLYMHNSDHSITNSVIVGSYLRFQDGLDHYENNCIWQTKGLELGTIEDPQFVNVQDDPFSMGDYTVQNSDCVGSRLTNIDQLFSLPDRMEAQ